MTTRIIIFCVALSILPLISSAQNQVAEYQPLVTGIPGVTDSKTTPTLVDYLNAIFTITISIAAVVAVIRIVFEGFRYMMTDAWGSKEEATGNIRAVVIGLIVLLLSVVILKTINPKLLELNILQPKQSLNELNSTLDSV